MQNNELNDNLIEIKSVLNDIKTLLQKLTEYQEKDKKEKEPKTVVKEKETVQQVFYNYTTNESLRKALMDFAESRKIAKSTVTVRAANLLLKKLDELGKTDDEKIKLVEQSTMNGWKSIYPLSEKNKQSGVKQTTFNGYEQRTEDYDAIEKRALEQRLKRKGV